MPEPARDAEAFYRPREVVQVLKIDDTTFRLWCTRFAEFLSPAAARRDTGEGAPGPRRISRADLRVLERIGELRQKEGLRYDEIHRRLRQELPETAAPGTVQAPRVGAGETAAFLDEVAEAYEAAVRAKAETVAELRRMLDRQEMVIRDLQIWRNSAEAEIDQLRKRLDEARTESRYLERQLRRRQPWWKRLFDAE
jgi:hypothetical protein